MGFFFSERMYAPVEHDFLPDLLREFFLGSGGVHEFFGKSMFAGVFFKISLPLHPPPPKKKYIYIKWFTPYHASEK